MTWEHLIRQQAACWLALIDLVRAPLEVWASSGGAPAEDEEALQREVWEEWGKQPPPLDEVLFA